VVIEILEATRDDAREIAEIHLAARREAMPYLHRAHTDDETRDWFASSAGDRQAAWWTAWHDGHVAGYMLLSGEDLDHLYVLPASQGHGIGTALLNKAKTLSPDRLSLSTAQRNTKARTFYEAFGFVAVGFTDGDNEEHEPDVQYVWERSLHD
jgi:GNAT superfamily N-acetyltransferase